ncbi:hypothetical protein Trydic_g4866, partial [Trypoxylus dichotomus]
YWSDIRLLSGAIDKKRIRNSVKGCFPCCFRSRFLYKAAFIHDNISAREPRYKAIRFLFYRFFYFRFVLGLFVTDLRL